MAGKEEVVGATGAAGGKTGEAESAPRVEEQEAKGAAEGAGQVPSATLAAPSHAIVLKQDDALLGELNAEAGSSEVRAAAAYVHQNLETLPEDAQEEEKEQPVEGDAQDLANKVK